MLYSLSTLAETSYTSKISSLPSLLSLSSLLSFLIFSHPPPLLSPQGAHFMSNAMYSARDTVIVAPPGAAYEMPASSNNMDQQGECRECRRVGRFVSLT